MRIKELNLEVLGATLLKVTPVAMQLGEKWPKSSLEDNVDPSQQVETEFIRDLFTLTTDEIVEKWYDGKQGAAKLLYLE